MPLDYLSCLALVLRVIHERVIIVFTPNKEFSTYSEVVHGGTIFKLTKS